MPDPPTLLQRVQKRIETDLDADELGSLIAEAQQEIFGRYGADRDTEHPITVRCAGARSRLTLYRPLDEAETVEITEFRSADPFHVELAEIDDEWPAVSLTPLTLADDDFRVWHGGRTLERLFTGTNPRTRWASIVEVSYVPVDDQARRDELVIKLVNLSIEYEGVSDRTVGDTRTTHSVNRQGSPTGYFEERERLLASLSPRPGLLLA